MVISVYSSELNRGQTDTRIGKTHFLNIIQVCWKVLKKKIFIKENPRAVAGTG